MNGTENKFLTYNGVELEESLNLNMYEMDFRQYDPAIARFTSIDPVTHFDYSTYSAFDNNPVYWADPSGANAVYNWDTGRYEDEDGNEVTYEQALASHGLNADGSKKDKNKKNKTTTDAGHGIDGSNNPKVDPGTTDGTHYEKDYALKVEEQIDYWLEQFGIDNQRTREGNLKIEENSLNYRWRLANEYGSIVLVSIHLNSGDKEGLFITYDNSKNRHNTSKSISLGNYIMKNVKSLLVSDKGVFKRASNDPLFIRYFKGEAAVLVELGGIGNVKTRNAILRNSSSIGKEIATGIYQYLNGGKKPPMHKPVRIPPISSELKGY